MLESIAPFLLQLLMLDNGRVQLPLDHNMRLFAKGLKLYEFDERGEKHGE